MAGDVWSIDQAVAKVRPRIELRGQLYEVADLSPGDEYLALYEIAEAEQALLDAAQKQKENGDAADANAIRELQEKGRTIMRKLVAKYLVDVPEEMAGTLTTLEFKALCAIIGAISEVSPAPEKKSVSTPPPPSES